MPNPMMKLHDLETDTIIEREMTNQEYEDYLKSSEPTPEEIAKKQAKENAKAKLEALGLTLDDLAALGF